jgi:hypothetical protein
LFAILRRVRQFPMLRPALHAVVVIDAKQASPAEYPALFPIQRLSPHIGTVFEFGGRNWKHLSLLFAYTDMPGSLSWSILDLPETSRTGAEVAKERHEPRVRFPAQGSD